MLFSSLKCNAGFRRLFIFSCLPFLSAPFSEAQVTSLSGSFTTSYQLSRYSFRESSGINITGPDFSLSGDFPCDGSFPASATDGGQTVTFTTSASITELATGLPGCYYAPQPNTATLVYKGQKYTDVGLKLSFVGLKAVVPDGNACCFPINDFYAGSVAGVAFSMTGLVSVYPANGSTTAALFTVPISGLGVFSAAATGALPSSGTEGQQSATSYQFLPSPAGFATDTTTHGNWIGSYGGDGYLIPNGPSYLPSYAAVSVSQASIYTWAAQTSDIRALSSGPNTTTGVASAYTANSFDVNIYFTDSYLHRISLYLLDFDTSTRSEVITINDMNTGAVLDRETVSSFHNGAYANFELQGNVRINVTSNGPGSAVVSGIFFGPAGLTLKPGSTTSTALLYSSGPGNGSWTGHYGSSGYLITDGPSSFPDGTSINVAGAIPYVWAAQTSDPRALQSGPGSSTGIAAAFTQYPAKSFAINVQGNTAALHRVTLYLLDWDNSGRAETLTVTDLSSGAVLNTQTVSNFQSGMYLAWLTSGNISITVKPVGATSPAVSGIFLD